MRLSPALALVALVAAPAAASAATATADVANREHLALTIYQGGFALVEDTRRATLEAGPSTVLLPDVSDAMIAASAQVLGAGVSVRAMGVGGPVADTASLLRAVVGQEITVQRRLDSGEVVSQRARILRADPEVIAEIDGKIHVGLPGQPVFDALPPDLPLLPGLSATVDAAKAGATALTLRYLTHNLSWSADHVMTLAPGRTKAELSTWATLRNGTNQDWRAASLAVVAGDVTLVGDGVSPPRAMMARAAGVPMMEKADASGFSREAADGVHIYRLDGQIDLKAGETRQVRLLDGTAGVPIEMVYEDEGMPYTYHAQVRGGTLDSHPAILLVLRNPADGPLGAPLPAGPVRVYATDADGRGRFVGGVSMPPLPVGEEARLDLARAFDLTVERTQTAFQQVADRVTETTLRVVVRNGGDEAATVRIVEPLPGDWEITQASQKAEKLDASRAVWPVKVPAKGKAELTFTVRTRL